jgi:hypothetical protein
LEPVPPNDMRRGAKPCGNKKSESKFDFLKE